MADKPTEHGTLTGYKIRGCRCRPCTDAQLRYNARRARLILYGQWQPYVDAQPVRDHVNALSNAGLGFKRVARLAGVPTGSMSKLLYGNPQRGMGPSKGMRPKNAAAILAVRADLDTLADGARTDAAGTRRRMQALACLGWSLSEQSRRVGWTTQNYCALQTRDQVNVGTARAVRDLYEQLSMTPAPEDKNGVVRARNDAARKGYLPPLAWDDDLIDLPEDQLKAELGARVAAMDDEELLRCHNGHRKLGDRSPLIRAGAAEYARRKKARALVRAAHLQEGSTAA